MRDILGAFDLMLYRLFDLELRVPQALRSPYRGAVVIRCRAPCCSCC
jgi:hypothetical protein